MSAPDPLKEGASVALSMASELTSVVFAIQNLQLRLVTIPKHQGGKAAEKPSTGPNLKAQQAADQLKFQSALNDRWLAAAGPVETTRAWAAALPWASQDRTAARAVSRCEARLTVINPRAMAGYQELRLKGVDRADAMVQVAPLFDQPGGGGVRPEGPDVGASIAASAAAADEIVDAVEADQASTAAATKVENQSLADRPADALAGDLGDDLSLDALDRTERQPGIGANGDGPAREATAAALAGVPDGSLDDDRTAPTVMRDPGALPEDVAPRVDVADTRALDTGTSPPGQAPVYDWADADTTELGAPAPAPADTGPAAAPDATVAEATAPAVDREGPAPQPAADVPGMGTPSAGSDAPAAPSLAATAAANPDGDLTAPAAPLAPPSTADTGPDLRDLDGADLDPGERAPAPAASPTSGLVPVHGTADEPGRDLPQAAPGESVGATEGVVQSTPPPTLAPVQPADALGADPGVPGRPEAVPGNAVTDRASETLADQELGNAAAERAQPDIRHTAADEHSMGIEQAERHAHTADTLHASAVEPAPRPRPAETPEEVAGKGLGPSELESSAPLAQAVNRPKRPKNKPTPPTPGRDRGQGRGLGH